MRPLRLCLALIVCAAFVSAQKLPSLPNKPNAKRERPFQQLLLYALALSRRTGLRLHDFKCAWFDERDYFEFFPLHAVYHPNKSTGSDGIDIS